MTEQADRQSEVAESGPDGRPVKVPLTVRLMLHESLTARRAAVIIAAFVVLITLAGGLLIRLLDHKEYPTFGKGLWFALQTVTTVGYGDVTPERSSGRVIATVVMLAGIGILAVITASVTASLVEAGRRRFVGQSETETTEGLAEITQRLARIEARLDQLAPPRSPDGRS